MFSLLVRSAIAIYFLHGIFTDVYLTREPITKVLYLFTCISAFMALISISIYTPQLIRTLIKIDNIDKILNMPSYSNWVVISGIALTIVSAIVIIFYTVKFLTDDTWQLITEYFSFAQSFIILIIILIIFNILVMILRQRFQKINHLIKEYDNSITFYVKPNSTKTAKKQNQRDFLNSMTDIHYALCECARLINETYSVALFFCVHIVYGEIIYIAYTVKYPLDSITKDVHFIMFAFLFTMQLISVLVCSHLTEREVCKLKL